MIDLKKLINKAQIANNEKSAVLYWNKDICGFEPQQNKEETLLPYSKEQVNEMLSQGIAVAGADGRPIVVPRPEPTAEQRQAQYKRRVDELIRSKYTLSQELAIIRQQATKSEEYQAYFDYCEECKAIAKAEVYGNEV
ncbi:MAG: hypothetical protein K2L70_00760 [Clostridia bacterium]|nr:hypothetical protein [Clostridia bacterium]